MEESNRDWYILIWGLDTEDSVSQLGPGVSVKRLDLDLSFWDLAAAGAAGFRAWTMLEPFCGGCHCEIETLQDAATKPGHDSLNRAWLASALLKLRGYSAHLPLACSAYSWNIVAGHQERRTLYYKEVKEKGIELAGNAPAENLPPFEGQQLELHNKLFVKGKPKSKLEKIDATWIYDNFEKFNALDAESESFRFALSAAIDWQYSSSQRVAIARLWSGIEAVLGISSELVYRISLLIASLLEPRGAERQNKFNQVQKLYVVRSKAIHGKEASDEILTRAMFESFDILSKLLLLNVEKGLPFTKDDFERAIFW